MKLSRTSLLIFVYYFTVATLFVSILSLHFVKLYSGLEKNDFSAVQEAERDIRTTTYILFPYFLSSIAVSYFVYYKPEIERLQDFLKTLKALEKGNINAETDKKLKKRDDEWGELARAFDRISVSIKLAIKEEREKNENGSKKTD